MVVMSAEDLPARPNRRATDGGPADSPRARQRRLVRHIASDPVLVGWLATSKARTLSHLAAELTAAGHQAAAELVQRKANALTSGELSPF
jgi:hypothetical protein